VFDQALVGGADLLQCLLAVGIEGVIILAGLVSCLSGADLKNTAKLQAPGRSAPSRFLWMSLFSEYFYLMRCSAHQDASIDTQ